MDDLPPPSAQPTLPSPPQKATTTTTTTTTSSTTSNTAPQQQHHPPQHVLLATFMTDDRRGNNNNGNTGAETIQNVKPNNSQIIHQNGTTTQVADASTTTITTSRNQKDTASSSSFSSSSLVFEVEEIPAAAASGQAQGVEPTMKAAAIPPPSAPKSPTLTADITERTIPLPAVDNGGGDDDNDEDVQVILPPPPRPPATRDTTTGTSEDDDDLTATTILQRRQEQRKERLRKTRRFLRILKKKTNQGRPNNGLPSFLALVNTNIDEDEDDEGDKHDNDNDSSSSPFRVVIDVDAYLGLKQKNPDLVRSLTSSSSNHNQQAGQEELSTMMKPLAVPSSRISTTTLNNNTTTTTTTTPVEEGYYEGSLPMAMPEDATYLSDIHVYLRQHLEFFSATDLDVELSHTGRRTKAVRGQVGIRCRHCAQHVLAQAAEQSQQGGSSSSSRSKISWPPGAVSYPVKFEGLYSTASQKPQLHFEACPYLPLSSKLAQLIQETRSEQPGNAPLTGIGKRKRMVQGMSGLEYYIVSCQRVGLQEIPGGRGIRFTRDLSLAPLDFDRIRAQVEQDRPDLIPRQHHVAAAAATTSKARKTPKIELSSLPQAASVQKVLQEALKEPDNSKEFLIRSQDKAYLTDYMFLAISQMALCWASRQDFAARGKRTKNLRLGLTGFCCKHCYRHNNGANSCRSYSSAPDNLASAISNSFILHLQKCPYTPLDIKSALVTAKRYHTQQMGQMVYGSQRKLFLELWDRMRAKDKIVPEDEEKSFMNKEEDNEDQEEWNPDEGGDADGTSQPPAAAPAPAPLVATTTFDEHRPNTRGPDFPMSTDPEVVATLKKAEENWDISVNDHLIEPQDRHLVSDYVFLTMRQLKSAMPRPSDFRGNRRNNILNHMPGLACIHCAHDPLVTSPSGRSFPSAPDNMASALNSSFSNHMQYCPHLDPTIKRCLAILRKIHSQQCASMNFGSQRKYFTRVFEKLKAIPMPNTLEEELPTVFGSRGNGATPSSAKDLLRDHAFVQAGTNLIPFWQCLKCRMVPFEFRGVGGVHYVQPILPHLQQHRKICKEDGIHLGWTLIAVKELWAKYGSSRQEEGRLESAMKPLIEIVVGQDSDLTDLFLECLASRGNETPELTERNTQGWWRRLPHSVDSIQLQQAFEASTCQLLDLASTQLEDHPLILRLLEIMSPCLQYQQPVTAPPMQPQQAEGRTSPMEVDEGLVVPKTMPLESQRTEQLPQQEGGNQGDMLISAIDSSTGMSSRNLGDEMN